jgi:crotonobetainyl-CoA hydratase
MTLDYRFIDVSATDHITYILLNRPEAMNTINPEMHAELEDAFNRFASDAAQYVAVVKGSEGRAFCAGSDLKAIAAGGRVPYPEHGYAGLIERFDLAKPVIAAVDGYALGGGFEIALACDVIIATSRSTFGLPEPLVGSVALGGGLHRLARQVGLKQAMGIVLTAERITAARGFEMGFVNEVTKADALDATVEHWCSQMLRCAPLALAASKEAILMGLSEPGLDAAISNQSSYPAFHRWQRSEDALEGPRAFAEKRDPEWKGR